MEFDRLPTEILEEVLLRLGPRDIETLEQKSESCKMITSGMDFWDRKAKLDFGFVRDDSRTNYGKIHEQSPSVSRLLDVPMFLKFYASLEASLEASLGCPIESE